MSQEQEMDQVFGLNELIDPIKKDRDYAKAFVEDFGDVPLESGNILSDEISLFLDMEEDDKDRDLVFDEMMTKENALRLYKHYLNLCEKEGAHHKEDIEAAREVTGITKPNIPNPFDPRDDKNGVEVDDQIDGFGYTKNSQKWWLLNVILNHEYSLQQIIDCFADHGWTQKKTAIHPLISTVKSELTEATKKWTIIHKNDHYRVVTVEEYDKIRPNSRRIAKHRGKKNAMVEFLRILSDLADMNDIDMDVEVFDDYTRVELRKIELEFARTPASDNAIAPFLLKKQFGIDYKK